jgi:hypothetical protein
VRRASRHDRPDRSLHAGSMSSRGNASQAIGVGAGASGGIIDATSALSTRATSPRSVRAGGEVSPLANLSSAPPTGQRLQRREPDAKRRVGVVRISRDVVVERLGNVPGHVLDDLRRFDRRADRNGKAVSHVTGYAVASSGGTLSTAPQALPDRRAPGLKGWPQSGQASPIGGSWRSRRSSVPSSFVR